MPGLRNQQVPLGVKVASQLTSPVLTGADQATITPLISNSVPEFLSLMINTICINRQKKGNAS